MQLNRGDQIYVSGKVFDVVEAFGDVVFDPEKEVITEEYTDYGLREKNPKIITPNFRLHFYNDKKMFLLDLKNDEKHKITTFVKRIKVYFAGSIRGGRQDQKDYFKIISFIDEYAQVLTEHIGKTELSDKGENLSDKQIHDRDMDWINSSNLVIAEVSNPSLGVGYEIGRAIEKGKSVLALYKEGSPKKLSAMINGSDKIINKSYKDLKEAKKIIDDFFNNYTKKY